HLTFSGVFLTYACLLVALGLFHRPGRWLHMPLGGLLFLLCFWSYSRMAWVAASICLLTLLALRSKRAFAVGSAGLILALGIMFFSDAGLRERTLRSLSSHETV